MPTVKIDVEEDELLEKLRAKMILRGKKRTKKDILADLIKKADVEEEMYNSDKIDNSLPLEKDPMWKILNNPDKTGLSNTSINIDEHIYT